MAKAARAVVKQTNPQVKSEIWPMPDNSGELFRDIIRRISEGEALVRICADKNEDGSAKYPSPATFLRWVGKDPFYAKQYARAIEIRSDLNVEMIVDIADTDPNVAWARNKIDARKYHNEKLAPKKYGAKFLSESTLDVNLKQKVDLTVISSQVRNQLRQALLMQIEHNSKEFD